MSKQKLAVLTGATGGLGRVFAHRLLQDGWRLLLVARDRSVLQTMVTQFGPEHQAIAVDLSDDKAPAQIAHQAAMMGGASLLVNNAGINRMVAFTEMAQDELTQMLQVNLVSPACLTHALLNQLESNRGTVVNIGSALGAIGFPYQSAYCASKFGLRGFSEALAREFSGTVAVKYLAPRAADTAINDESIRQLNQKLGNQMDSPQVVADEFMALLKSKDIRKGVGFPEKFFARLNGLLPELVDGSIIKQCATIRAHFAAQCAKFSSSSEDSV
ncbi:SDR family oxidoreductase [Pseudoalteromonas viridis]|uniref:SDR family oxidoreductase n=1 Tax=Pseudoalteromonas viridis TaxID=339617 RepID=A0ABX7VG67_9GAMM|nr:SDR family oxidoreductase [Pseudoalteromonas viridis]QTL37654.1 SDR family oxidoreductase [Pseudoalteromonas viridis]